MIRILKTKIFILCTLFLFSAFAQEEKDFKISEEEATPQEKVSTPEKKVIPQEEASASEKEIPQEEASASEKEISSQDHFPILNEGIQWILNLSSSFEDSPDEENSSVVESSSKDVSTKDPSVQKEPKKSNLLKILKKKKIKKDPKIINPSSIFKSAKWKGETEFYWIRDKSKLQILLTMKNYLKMDHTFSEFFHLDTEWLLAVDQGSTQMLYARSSSSGDQIEMLSSNISYRPTPHLDIRVGSFNMNSIAGYGLYEGSHAIHRFNRSFFSAPLLISDWPFIGLSQKYTYQSSYTGDMFFLFRQTIPSGTSELERFTQIRNLPQLITATLFASDIQVFKMGLDRFDLFSLEDRVTVTAHMIGFYFRNLSPEIAKYALPFGNTTEDIYQGVDSEFKYSFYGIHTSAGVYFNLFPNLDVELKTSLLWNFGAEKYHNKAQNLYIGFHMSIHPTIILTPSVEYFVNQSDASVAYYNSRRYGRSDRTGYIMGLRCRLNRYKAFVDVQYGVMRSISPVSAIGHPHYVKFSLGVDYGKI